MTIALLLVDFQRGILASDAIHFDDPGKASAAIAAAERVLAAARAAQALVVHVGVARSLPRTAFDAIRTSVGRKSGKAPRDVLPLAPGSEATHFLVAPRADEEVVIKMGVSAFQGTRLDTLLRSAGVTQVLLAGAFTHMAVESTARQGFDLGYHMLTITDACCAPAQAAHAGSLGVGLPSFSELLSADEAIARLG